MKEPKYKLGDTVFMTSYDREQRVIVCPDCLGSARVKVTLATGEEIMIECGACDPGCYQGSTGRIFQYDYGVRIVKRVITGINLQEDDVEYRLDGEAGHCYIGHQNGSYPVYATEDAAKSGGEVMRVQHEAEENKRLLAKTKNHKRWAWNANYHRQQIKRLEQEIAYHHKKVEICKSHVKEEGR
jgi:hypothetical protein